MGNGKMDTSFEKRQEMLKNVDESAGSLMSSLDSVHVTAGLLLKQLDTHTENSGQAPSVTKQQLPECKRTAQTLIMMLEGPVRHQKANTVESLSKLLHSIRKNSEGNSNNIEVSSHYLLIDDYKDSNVSKLAHDENRFKELLNENDDLQKELIERKRYIEVLDEKEESFVKEKSYQNQRIRDAEDRLLSAENERDQLKTKFEETKKQYENYSVTQTETIKMKEEENDNLVKTLQELQHEHKNKIETHEKEVTSLECKNKLLQTQIEEENKTKEKLREDLEKRRLDIIQKGNELRELKLAFENSKEENDEKISGLKHERDCLSTKCNNLTRDNDSMKNDINRTNLRNNDLRAKVIDKDKLISSKEQEIIRLQKQIDDKEMSNIRDKDKFEKEKILLNEINNELENKSKSLQNQLDKTEEENASIKDQILVCDSDIKKKDGRIKDLSYRVAELEKKLELLQTNYGKAKKNIEMLTKNLENETNELLRVTEDSSKDIEILKGELHSKEQQIVELRDDIDQMRQTLSEERKEAHIKQEQLKERIQNMLVEQTKLQDNIGRLGHQSQADKTCYENNIKMKDSKIHEQDTQITALRKTNRRQKEETENISKVLFTVEKELNMMKSKRIMQVQLYSQNRTHLTSSVEDEVTKLLKTKMESKMLELEFVQCAKSSDIQEDLPLLMLCITVSRLGTDVANAVHGLALCPKMALLIFHHKDVHALPNQASDRVLTRKEIKNLGGIYDIAFLTGRGIYPCEMNTNNIVSLINFVNREGVKKPIDECKTTLSR